MGEWVSGSMGGSGQITNNLINLDIIKIIQFCLKIYDLKETPPMDGYMDSCVDRWFSGSMGGVRSGHIAKYQINLDLIKIIQFCLKIYDLLRHPHLWVGVWVNGWGQVK